MMAQRWCALRFLAIVLILATGQHLVAASTSSPDVDKTISFPEFWDVLGRHSAGALRFREHGIEKDRVCLRAFAGCPDWGSAVAR